MNRPGTELATLHLTDRSWGSYLHRFHAERPGITERILTRCRVDGVDPYTWCAQGLADRRGPVVDLACGSGPMAPHLAGWIGLDTSGQELAAARDHHRGPLLLASATRLPIRTAAVGASVCSMSMQIIEPVADAVGELARILEVGGRAALLVPASRPLPWRHAVVYARLVFTLRQRIRYPNDEHLRPAGLAALAARGGLTVTRDDARAFALPLRDAADADDLLASLYLPGVDPSRFEAARRYLARRVGTELTLPLRRILLERTNRSS